MFNDYDLMDHNAWVFRRFAMAALAEDGETCPDEPPQGHTWKSYWNEISRIRAEKWVRDHTCSRCHFHPIQPEIGEKVCVFCEYREKGESLFVGEPIEHEGIVFKMDAFGRAHVPPDPLPKEFDWMIFRSLDRAIEFFDQQVG